MGSLYGHKDVNRHSWRRQWPWLAIPGAILLITLFAALVCVILILLCAVGLISWK